jgi:hypothetical protein
VRDQNPVFIKYWLGHNSPRYRPSGYKNMFPLTEPGIAIYEDERLLELYQKFYIEGSDPVHELAMQELAKEYEAKLRDVIVQKIRKDRPNKTPPVESVPNIVEASRDPIRENRFFVTAHSLSGVGIAESNYHKNTIFVGKANS